MSWSIGFDNHWNRDVGYGVPAICDAPNCEEEIDRGLSYVCGAEQPYGGNNGCGLYFCGKHKFFHSFRNGDSGFFCKKCVNHKSPYKPKPDVVKWINHKMTDESWAEWRKSPDLLKQN